MHEFDKCYITSITGGKLAAGFVTDYEAGVMRINLREGDSIPEAQEVYVYVYNSVKGECKYRGSVEKYIAGSLIVHNAELVQSIQKRENARVNKQLRYRITERFTSEGKVKLDEPIQIMILNVSAEGLYMNCEKELQPGHRFPLTFRETRYPIELNVEIVRREDFQRGFNYGCRFVGIATKDADEIFRFVLREQIEQRRKSFLF